MYITVYDFESFIIMIVMTDGMRYIKLYQATKRERHSRYNLIAFYLRNRQSDI
jgi:hypothetical protein